MYKRQRMEYDNGITIVANRYEDKFGTDFEVGLMVRDMQVVFATRTQIHTKWYAEGWTITQSADAFVTSKGLADLAEVLKQIDDNRFWWDAPTGEED